MPADRSSSTIEDMWERVRNVVLRVLLGLCDLGLLPPGEEDPTDVILVRPRLRHFRRTHATPAEVERFELLASSSRSQLVQRIVADVRNPHALLLLAGNPHLDPDVQTRLTRESVLVRRKLASHSHLHPSTELLLSRDAQATVQAALAYNSSISSETQHRLSVSPVTSVRTALAANPRLTPLVQATLLQDPSTRVHIELIENASFALTLDLPVPTLLQALRGRKFLDQHLEDTDPDAYRSLARDFAGSLEELLAVLESFAPESQLL